MALLLVDAGNTRVKWALAEDKEDAVPGNWTLSGSVGSDAVAGLTHRWRNLSVSRVLISNVAGQPILDGLSGVWPHAFTSPPAAIKWFASSPQMGGIRNGYRNPAQLGCDRFASMIGARALFPGRPLVVVTCGTATTIDVVTADGFFPGGLILPGLGLMAGSLAKHTAQLPQIAQHFAIAALLADNTDDAISSGCLAAQVGAIERAVASHANRQGPVQCLLSGGAAGMIAPHLSISCAKVDNLVLIGLQVVATQLKKTC